MDFKEQVKKGFASCKEDIIDLQENNKKLNEEVSSLKNQNATLTSQLNQIQQTLNEMKQSFQNTTPVPKPTPEVKQPHQEEDPYEALLAFKAKVNKREVLKQKITSMIGENGMILSELRFMFVDHFKYCSKATFYNYLKELEFEKTVKIERHQSKNIIFLEGMKNQI